MIRSESGRRMLNVGSSVHIFNLQSWNPDAPREEVRINASLKAHPAQRFLPGKPEP